MKERDFRGPSYDRLTEMKVYGWQACLQAFRCRPQSLVRAYFDDTMGKSLSDLVRFCVENRKAYHSVPRDELVRITETEHHEGLCLILKKKPIQRLESFLDTLPPSTDVPSEPLGLLVLHGVENPHNIGAILRVAAHFGMQGVVVDTPALLESAAVYRTAEGGAEHVQGLSAPTMGQVKHTVTLLQRFGFQVFATSSHAGHSLYEEIYGPRVAFILGSESHGLPREALSFGEGLLRIPGTGLVESLNVASAVTCLAGELWRQRGAPLLLCAQS